MKYIATVRRTVTVEIEAGEDDDRVALAERAAAHELGTPDDLEVIHIEPVEEPAEK